MQQFFHQFHWLIICENISLIRKKSFFILFLQYVTISTSLIYNYYIDINVGCAFSIFLYNNNYLEFTPRYYIFPPTYHTTMIISCLMYKRYYIHLLIFIHRIFTMVSITWENIFIKLYAHSKQCQCFSVIS